MDLFEPPKRHSRQRRYWLKRILLGLRTSASTSFQASISTASTRRHKKPSLISSMTSKSPQLPDIATFLLPTRAYLLSMKEQNLSLRRAALIDAESHFRERLDSDGEASELTRRALVGFIGEVFQILEDLAAYADSLLNAPSGTAFFAALTDYSRTRVNDFYTQLRKRPSEY